MKYFFIFLLFQMSLEAMGQSSNALAAPLYGFVENKGQVRDQANKLVSDVKFILQLPNNNLILKTSGFSYDTYWDEKDTTSTNTNLRSPTKALEKYRRHFHRVDIQLVNTNPGMEITAEGQYESLINFYQTGLPRQRQDFQAHHFKKVIYKNIYQFIDLEFVAEVSPDKPVEYNFIVHPGGNVQDIQMKYSGPTNMKVGRNQIEMKLTKGILKEQIPKSYWSENEERVKISYTSKKVINGNIIGFGGVNGIVSKELIIDPVPVLEWEKRITIGGNDRIEDFLVSSTSHIYAAGNALFGGASLSTSGAYQQSIAGGFDGLLIKYNSDGLIDWATYYGGVNSEGFLAIGERSNGDLIVTGYSDTIGIPIVVFSPSGSPTYSGGIVLNSGAVSQDLWIDESNNVYITGSTGATDLHTPNAPQTINQGWDGFVIKLSSSFSLQWGTYFGGSSNEEAYAIEGDGNGSVVIAGYTMSSDSIATPGAFQTSFGGGTFDTFLAKYTTSGTLQWSTYFGGSSNDLSYSLAIDSQNNIYLGGNTSSSSLETIGPSSSGSDGFLVKFSTAGARIWSTYYPSTYVVACQFDLSNRLFVGGHKWNGGFTNTAILAEFTTEGTLISSATYNRPAGGFNSFETPLALGVSEDYLYLAGEILNVGGGGFQFEEFFLAKFTKPCLPSSPISVQILSTQYSCAMQFAPSRNLGCQINSYAWNFGDGNTAISRNPVHKYAIPGTYTVSLVVNYSCGGCAADTTISQQITYSPQPVVLEDTLVEVSTQLKPQVISASASTFSDSWLLQHEATSLANANPFVNGSAGVWRNAASFVYDTDRQYSQPVNLATDGTFNLKQFDWKTADFEVIPDWIKATAMTEYSPFSYELENRDVIGVYTAALYDYGGHLPSANGVNMRNKEMAFTSFEFSGNVNNSNTTQGLTGNLLFGTNPTPDYLIYKIATARSNIAVVEAPMSALEIPASVAISTSGAASSNPDSRNKVFYGNQIVCMQIHPTRDDWSVVVFRDAISGLWSGLLRLTLEATPTVQPVFDSIRTAHTGKKSLKVLTNQIYKQPILRLDSAKNYVVSAWVAVSGSQPATPLLANDLGLVVTIKRRNGTTVSTTVVEPSGPIIEGWQQVKGVFACNIKNAQVELTFKAGSLGTAWYDDLRLHPEKGNMKSYVYDLKDYRLRAILDEENFASLFYYDAEGNLHITKKETREGIKTINENISYQVERE